MSHLTIGLVAYTADPGMVFVRVPNERGRWMRTKRCVIEVDCPHCDAIAGEPCRAVRSSWRSMGKPHEPIRYHSGVHVARDLAWSNATGHRHPARHAGPAKPRIRADELHPPPLDDLPDEAPPADIDFPVTRRTDGPR